MPSRDTDLGKPTRLDEDDVQANISEIGEVVSAIKYKVSKIVSCPRIPLSIPGIVAANALDANDCFGTVFEIFVPHSGIIYSATLWDLDDEGSQVDLEIFKQDITHTASDAVWSPTDTDMLAFVAELAFVSFDDHINSRTSELTNIGKAYTAPSGRFYIQAVTRSTPNIAAGSMPRVQLHILPDDPNWKER